jgi:hypothetical protein
MPFLEKNRPQPLVVVFPFLKERVPQLAFANGADFSKGAIATAVLDGEREFPLRCLEPGFEGADLEPADGWFRVMRHDREARAVAGRVTALGRLDEPLEPVDSRRRRRCEA